MGKPRLLIVIRHAQSEGNKNRQIHQSVPDHRIKLTPLGWQQARDAGRRLRALLRPDDTLQFFTSPYRRTRETTEGILETLTAPDVDSSPDPDPNSPDSSSDTTSPAQPTPSPSPFSRDSIKVYEEPRLREQDFGNFQPCDAEVERMWQERADYGHFFYRIPNGESAADAYDRVSGFNESLWRQFGDDDFPSVCVLVTHGLMSRVFLMKWYHFTVEYFEDLRNINHCEFLIMRKQEDTGKYLLETKLRTWSELHREHAERERDRDRDTSRDATSKEKENTTTPTTTTTTTHHHNTSQLERSKTFIVTRRWGGCPNGCNHSAHYKRRDDLEVLRQRDLTAANHANGIGSDGGSANGSGSGDGPGLSPHASSSAVGSSVTIASLRLQQRQQQQQQHQHPHHHHPHAHQHLHQQSFISDDDDSAPHAPDGLDSTNAPSTRSTTAPRIDVDRTLSTETVPSPMGTPSSILPSNRALKSPHFFNPGRDGGGSYSGVPSLAGSDAEQSDDDRRRRRGQRGHRLGGSVGGGRMLNLAHVAGLEPEGKYRGVRAHGLGDRRSVGSDLGFDGDVGHDGDAEDDLGRIEKEEKSISGSVY